MVAVLPFRIFAAVTGFKVLDHAIGTITVDEIGRIRPRRL
jgi:hypothetical protein